MATGDGDALTGLQSHLARARSDTVIDLVHRAYSLATTASFLICPFS